MDKEANIKESLRVLLVEDNFINQKVAQKMLQKLGVDPQLAVNGLEGFNMAKEKDYDLILMDLQMPVMDGLESARQILKFYDGKENVPKIIALTANVMKSDRQDCEEVGMVDFIPKPLQLASLGKVLEKWFGSNDHQPS